MPDPTIPELDPTTVPCPDCLAAIGTPCYITSPILTRSHAGRRDRVRHHAILATLALGTCAACGRELRQVTDPATGDPVDTWHPATAEGAPCPPPPSLDPYDAPGWLAFANAGLAANRPGHAQFIPEEPTGAPTAP